MYHNWHESWKHYFPSNHTTALAGKGETFQDGFPLDVCRPDGSPHIPSDRGVPLWPDAQVLGSVSERTIWPEVRYVPRPGDADGNSGNAEKNKSLYWNPTLNTTLKLQCRGRLLQRLFDVPRARQQGWDYDRGGSWRIGMDSASPSRHQRNNRRYHWHSWTTAGLTTLQSLPSFALIVPVCFQLQQSQMVNKNNVVCSTWDDLNLIQLL